MSEERTEQDNINDVLNKGLNVLANELQQLYGWVGQLRIKLIRDQFGEEQKKLWAEEITNASNACKKTTSVIKAVVED